MYCNISVWKCTGLKKPVPVQKNLYQFKKICTSSKKLELVQIQIVPKDKLNYNIYIHRFSLIKLIYVDRV